MTRSRRGRSRRQDRPHASNVANSRGQDASRSVLPWLAPTALFLVMVASYARSFANGFVYDDTLAIERQQSIHSLGDLARIFAEPHYPNLPYYRPLTRVTFVLQKTIFGDAPLAFHVFNAVLVGLLAVWTFRLLRRSSLVIPPGLDRRGARGRASHRLFLRLSDHGARGAPAQGAVHHLASHVGAVRCLPPHRRSTAEP